ncbi:MAG: Do family serine endopeptidase [Gammaproteobacteria bacterium]|jgi:serine protease Do|nr:Do family serine endopeptidase [Gammaproteobacteria bacterium]
MFRTLTLSAVLLICAASAPAFAEPDFTGLVEESIPAVVNITTTRFGTRPGDSPEDQGDIPEDVPEFFRRFFEEPYGEGRGRPDRMGGGSGFILESDGLVITNHHVIDGADEIIVRLSDRREYEAELVGSDPETDIAVLRIPADDLPTLAFGPTEDLKPGQWVIAIGSPFQFEQSVTAGIVSAKGRSQGAQQQYVPFIQTDVAINRGNSGGPLISTDGRVVGINSWILSSHGGNIGLSFSIPSEVAQNSIEQLLEHGRVKRGYLGVVLQAVTREQADALGLERPAGALINQVEPGSPADEAGIRVGDVILAFEDQPIDRHSELPPLVGMERPGTEVEMSIWRWGERETLEVTLGEREGEAVERGVNGDSEAQPSNALGLVVEPLDQELRQRFGDPEGGVLITEVESDNAYRAGIRRNQLIMMINNREIADMDDFNAVVEDIEPGQTVALLVREASGASAFLAYQPENGAED